MQDKGSGAEPYRMFGNICSSDQPIALQLYRSPALTQTGQVACTGDSRSNRWVKQNSVPFGVVKKLSHEVLFRNSVTPV